MKRFLRLFFVLTMLLALVACTKEAGFPEVNEKDEVELEYNEVLDEFDGVAMDNQVLKLELDAEIKALEGDINLEGIAHIGTGAAMLNLKIASNMTDGNLGGEATIYANEAGVFFNGEVEISAEGMSMTLEGKYKVDDTLEDFVGEDINFDEFLDLDINDLLQNDQFQRLVEEYEGLTFYKKGNKFQLRLIVTNELLSANKELLLDVLGMGELTDGQEIDFEFVITVEDKKLTALGLRMEMVDPTEDIEVKLTLTATIVNEMPAFPTDLDEYEPFNMMDFM